MGLKELKSKHDLVQGTDPVGKMEGQLGPKFQRHINDASNVHTDSLKDLPITSKYQDINGVPDTKYNRDVLNTSPISDSPFKGPFVQENGGPDHMVSLLNKSVMSDNTDMTYKPSPQQSQYQDMDGYPGPKFDKGSPSTVHADPNQKTPTELVASYHSTVHNKTYGPVPTDPTHYQDLNGENGTQFDVGEGNPSQVHADPSQGATPTQLVKAYNSPQGWTQGVAPGTFPSTIPIGPVPVKSTHYADLNGQNGIQFDVGEGNKSQVHGETGDPKPTQLVKAYNSPQGWKKGLAPGASAPNVPIGPVPIKSTNFADLDGSNGPSFMNTDSIQTQLTSLEERYKSTINPDSSYAAGQPGATWPHVNKSELDINNNTTINEATFDKGPESSILKDLMTKKYEGDWPNHNKFGNNQGIKQSNYSQGQPGGTWPKINPTPFDRIDANSTSSPSGYTHPEFGFNY
jgi:hypothetical protein|tara:strand:+ start:720 stop:2093 length:1374 start_codon:yes stop_codon:yes gene_type:complete